MKIDLSKYTNDKIDKDIVEWAFEIAIETIGTGYIEGYYSGTVQDILSVYEEGYERGLNTYKHKELKND